MTCPVSPFCPYCDQDSRWEDGARAFDDAAQADAHAREWDPEDMFPDDMIDNPTPAQTVETLGPAASFWANVDTKEGE